MLREELNNIEIEIPARLSGVVDESLKEVGKIHRRKVGKRACAVCGSFFALVGAVMAFGFLNPAMASEIPFLGNFFKNVSTKTGDFPTNLNGYDSVQAVGKLALTDNSDWKLLAGEAYSDGDAVQIGLEFSAPAETMDRFDYLKAEGKDKNDPCEAAINGEKAETDTVSIFTREGKRFIGAVRITVPESQRAAEKLDVSFTLRELQGELAENGEHSNIFESVPGEFKLEFPVVADRENKVEFTCAAEDNGAKVLAVKSTPAQTVITVEQPYWGDVHENVPDDGSKGFPILYTMDGTKIEMYHGATYEGGWRYNCKEAQTADLYFDGVPAGTKQVLLRFCNDNKYLERKKLAEFTIDLEKRTVTPAGTVVDADWGTPYDGVAILGNLDRGQEQNGYAVTCVTFQYDNGVYSALALFDSKNGKVGETERLRLEAADGTGRVIFRSDSVTEQGNPASFQKWCPQYSYSEYDMDFETARETLAPTGYGVRETLTEENGWVMAGDTVTVTISDLDSGEILCTDTRTLERME